MCDCLVHSWVISVVDSNELGPVQPFQVKQSKYEDREDLGAMRPDFKDHLELSLRVVQATQMTTALGHFGPGKKTLEAFWTSSKICATWQLFFIVGVPQCMEPLKQLWVTIVWVLWLLCECFITFVWVCSYYCVIV